MNIDDAKRPDPVLMRQLVGEQVSQAPTPHPWSVVADRPNYVPTDSEPPASRSRALVVAVAASLLALVGILGVLGVRDEPDSPSNSLPSPPSVGPVPLAEVTDVADNQWVVPAEVPGEMEFQYAMGGRGGRRSVRAGTDAQPERLSIHLDPVVPVGTAPPDVSTSSLGVGTSEVSIGGRQWVVTPGVGGWKAWLLDGTPEVVVYGSGAFGTDDERVLGSLQVVPTEQLPYPPLNPDGPMTEVASFDLDGERWVVSVEETNGYYCARISNGDGGGTTGCGGSAALGSGVFASFVGGGATAISMGLRRSARTTGASSVMTWPASRSSSSTDRL